ncbi:hypothetical protein FOA52_010721 [Chlamydomonas sp. UWO 241]|nr:hypothetical protein FOA52_010721 [Chlamydomonas sp. UWO 241]
MLAPLRAKGVSASGRRIDSRRSRMLTRADSAALERVQLGNSDLNVSIACLGTMTFGQQNSEAEAHELLNYAVHEASLNFIDTSEMYPIPTLGETQGRTDRYIGSWLKGQKRQDIVLASKVAGFSLKERLGYVRDPPVEVRVTPDQIVQSVDRSLQRLGTDYIDLLQVHWPDRYVPMFGAAPYDIKNERADDVPFEEQLLGLEKVVKAGKVRYVGVSNETSWGVSEFCHAAEAAGLPKIQTIQNSYSLLVRTSFETDLAETCRRHNVSLLAYSPLAGGALTNKSDRPADLSATRTPGREFRPRRHVQGSSSTRARKATQCVILPDNYYNDGRDVRSARLKLFESYIGRYNTTTVKEATAAYASVAAKHGLTPTELALAFCKSRWFVASMIFGATSIEQLRQNMTAFEKDLPEEALADIYEVFKRFKDPTLL